MIEGKRVLAVCQARGGSKGIPLKNLRKIGGRPMVALVGDVVRQVPLIDRAVISTDHAEIARVAAEAGLAAPFMRPDDLAGDRIADIPVLQHALQECERIDGVRYDIAVLLQPTAPLREPEQVEATIRKLVEEDLDSVWTLSETDSKGHPLKQLVVGEEDQLDYYDPKGAEIVARQQLKPVYHRNGVCYALTRECVMEQGKMKGRKTGALVLEGEFVSIDTEWDIELTEFILSRKK